MVKTISVDIWVCPYCSAKFHKETDCEDHLTEHLDFPIDLEEMRFVCDVCKKQYEHKVDAMVCEEQHKNGDDLKYQAYLDEVEREKLERASKHPEQRKLIEK